MMYVNIAYVNVVDFQSTSARSGRIKPGQVVRKI